MVKQIMLAMCMTVSFFSVSMAADSTSWDWLPMKQIDTAVEAAEPAIEVVKKTWDKESLLDIMQGRIAVPDTAINEAIAQKITADDSVKSMTITSHDNGMMDLHINSKKLGHIELSGTLDAFVHNSDASYMTYNIKDKELKDHTALSWLFSRLSLSMMEKLTGRIEISDDIPVNIKGNAVTVDFHQYLKKSDLGQTTVYGYNLLDALRIEKAVPHDGYIEFRTALNVPDEVKWMLLKLL
jgi:hypothetical protein